MNIYFNQEETLKDLVNKIDALIKKGSIKSVSNNTNEFGYIIEKYLKLDNNSLPIPDYNGVEIKCRYKNSLFPFKLFSVSLDGDEPLAFQQIFKKYSIESTNCYKSFNKTFFANRKTIISDETSGKLMVDYKDEKVYLAFYNNGKINNCYYWTFKTLYDRLYLKLKCVFIVTYSVKYINWKKYYKIEGYNCYNLVGFDAFLGAIEKGKIYINFSMQQREKEGIIKSHGPGFSIDYKNINCLFKEIKKPGTDL